MATEVTDDDEATLPGVDPTVDGTTPFAQSMPGYFVLYIFFNAPILTFLPETLDNLPATVAKSAILCVLSAPNTRLPVIENPLGNLIALPSSVKL